MSALVFPTLVGRDIKIRREPIYNTVEQNTLTRTRLAYTYETYPLYRYTLNFNLLRSSALLAELQQLAGFLAQHSGSLDNFLWQDPEDNAVTDHGFGVGDGVTTAFQLQRALLGGVYDIYGGPWSRSSKPRTNICLRSADFGDAAWTKTSASVLTDAVMAPDGTPTADRFVPNTSNVLHFISQTLHPSAGATVTHSVFAKAAGYTVFVMSDDGIGTSTSSARFDLSSGTLLSKGSAVLSASITACGNGWFRCSMSVVAAAASAGPVLWANDTNTFAGDGTSGVYLWGAQTEVASAATQYVATTSAAVTSTPSYWSATSDGFEPVFDLNGAISVFIDKDWQGYRQLYQTARTNLCLRSQTPTDASWTKTSLTDNGAVADPAGTTNAERYTSTATATAALSRSVAGLTAGYQYTASAWLRCAAGGTVKLGTTEGTSATLSVTSTWQRFTWTFAAAGASTTLTLGGSSTWANTQILEVYGFQLELGATATSYIATAAAAVTFTDIASIAAGLVTFGAAPASGTALSWTGSYWRRVRFDTDSIPMDRIVQAMWEAKQVALISVKGTGVGIVSTPLLPRTETPSGTINGTTGSDGNPTFTLSRVPLTNTPVNVYLRGARLQLTSEYTVSGQTITMLASKIPITGDVLTADYYAY